MVGRGVIRKRRRKRGHRNGVSDGHSFRGCNPTGVDNDGYVTFDWTERGQGSGSSLSRVSRNQTGEESSDREVESKSPDTVDCAFCKSLRL